MRLTLLLLSACLVILSGCSPLANNRADLCERFKDGLIKSCNRTIDAVEEKLASCNASLTAAEEELWRYKFPDVPPPAHGR